MKSVTSSIKQNILAGIVVLVPFGLTIFILFIFCRWVINWVSAAPARFIKPIEALPEPLFQVATFSIGLIGTIIIVLVIGTIARNFIGKKMVVFFEGLISRIPLARTVYIATKQIIETLFFAAA